MTETEQRWVDQARDDLDAARTMLDARKYVYVLFFCQQTVEKALKALIIHRTGKWPPRINNLVRLVKAAGIPVNPDQNRFFRELSSYYRQTIFLQDVRAICTEDMRKIATENFRKTEESTQWLFSML